MGHETWAELSRMLNPIIYKANLTSPQWYNIILYHLGEVKLTLYAW